MPYRYSIRETCRIRGVVSYTVRSHGAASVKQSMQPSQPRLSEGAVLQAQEHVRSLCAQGKPVEALAVSYSTQNALFFTVGVLAHNSAKVKLFPGAASYCERSRQQARCKAAAESPTCAGVRRKCRGRACTAFATVLHYNPGAIQLSTAQYTTQTRHGMPAQKALRNPPSTACLSGKPAVRLPNVQQPN